MASRRRKVITAIAAMPPVPAIALTPDPIFAIIDRYRRALAELQASIDRDGRAAEAAEAELAACDDALFATEPTTLAGCVAMVAFVLREMVTIEDDTAAYRALEILHGALTRLTAIDPGPTADSSPATDPGRHVG